ncbi:MAG: D-arabinono-1,4-lactone oxidase [Hyphomonadaceae bacterium]|nr:D-arabinono-1,4-lactone oxidase [Hyphomonadaceae bacterium]
MAEWRNWSGSVRATPASFVRPATEAALSAAVAQARHVRVVGAGHSFMPLCETTDTLVSLSALEGALEIDAAANRAWAPAGWSLSHLTAALWAEGYALINQGDVNPQSLAGAVATGTHGTGAGLGSLATAARAFRLVLADGTVATCSAQERPELFEAQRVSLGMLGVVTRIQIDVLPAYHLEEVIETLPLDAVEERWETLAAENRHVEFWVFPYGDVALLKRLNPAPSEGDLKVMKDFEETAFRRMCDLCTALPVLTPVLQRRLVRAGLRTRRVGPSYQIFPSERTVRFEEMEYEVPRAQGFAALRAVIGLVRRKRLPIAFPFEFRLTAADDIWLSPFNKGDCASISMHQYAKMPWRPHFAAAEEVLRAHGGRPHWGKRHTLNAADVRALYPMADRFCAVRAEVDPAGKFLNAHLGALFGADALARAA